MRHKMRHDGACTCGGLPLYVADPQEMLVCSLSGEAMEGERALRSLREHDSSVFQTPERRQRDKEVFLQWCRDRMTKPHLVAATEDAVRCLRQIMDLMRRYHAAERYSDEERLRDVRTEIAELPLKVQIPGGAKKSGDGNTEPSEADELNAVIIDLPSPDAPTCVRILLSPAGDTEMQYTYKPIPWTTLPLLCRQQDWLDNFGAEFALDLMT